MLSGRRRGARLFFRVFPWKKAGEPQSRVVMVTTHQNTSSCSKKTTYSQRNRSRRFFSQYYAMQQQWWQKIILCKLRCRLRLSLCMREASILPLAFKQICGICKLEHALGTTNRAIHIQHFDKQRALQNECHVLPDFF